ncbi:MAG: ABC-F family ATP-binding cassette domain-containing protein [Lachnospiraceae bacterium]
MLYQIIDGTVTAGGHPILSHIDFEIKGNEKIAVVGKNGAGKTTLLKLIAGQIGLDRDDKRTGSGIRSSRQVTIEMLSQQAFSDPQCMVEEEILKGCPGQDLYARERFEYEREYDILFTGFGFLKTDKKRLISEFSGGEQTKIAMIRLLLAKPDILLLDEPTSHLDIKTTGWLEQYLKRYEKSVVMVSHDRFFLNQTADVVYELEHGRLNRYPGDYNNYKKEKEKRLKALRKAYDHQQEEKMRLEELITRFKHKPTKSAFARAKKKQIERMPALELPQQGLANLFFEEIFPEIPGSKWVWEAEHLKVGYDRNLFELSLRIRRGQKIGLLGDNGTGKTTLLKTVAGLVPAISGKAALGVNITIGYFDQHSADIQSDKTVAEHFHDLFPGLIQKDVRSILGHYLFAGNDANKRVSSLSGGEKARLVLAELLQSRPNFLILDEPTNHMDIQAKETLEAAFRAFKGTILFVSHDRYFIDQVAESVLILEDNEVMYYPFGYSHYMERKDRQGDTIAAQVKAEDQALIEGMRAVPRVERHRLREIPETEAYLDWKLRLVMDKLEPAEERYKMVSEQLQQMQQEWLQTEEYWNGGGWLQQELCQELYQKSQEAWEVWHEQCLEWLEIWQQEL